MIFTSSATGDNDPCQILLQRKWWLALTKSEAAAFLVSWHGIAHKKLRKLWAKVVLGAARRHLTPCEVNIRDDLDISCIVEG